MTMPTVMYAAAPQPMVYNISPEMFSRIATGGALTQEELNGLMGGSTIAAPTMAMPTGTTAVATTTSTKDAKSSKKKVKVSKKKKSSACC